VKINDILEYLFWLSGFIVIIASFFVPFSSLEKALMLLIGIIIVAMLWL